MHGRKIDFGREYPWQVFRMLKYRRIDKNDLNMFSVIDSPDEVIRTLKNFYKK